MPPRARPLKEAVKTEKVAMAVCAWVTWFSVPRTSSGSDHFMILHLSDESLTTGDMAFLRNPSNERQHDERPYVTCVIFGPQHLLPQFHLQDLPRLIYLHSTKTVVYRSTGERQLQVKLRSVKAAQDGDLFSLYSEEGAEKNGLPPVALATSHPPSSMRHQLVDNDRIKMLRRWVADQLRQQRATLPAHTSANSMAEVQDVSCRDNQQLKQQQPQQQQLQEQRLETLCCEEQQQLEFRNQGLQAIWQMVPPLDADRCTPVPGPMPRASIICRVLAVDFSITPNYYIIHVWDGTNAYSAPAMYDSSPLTATGDEPPAKYVRIDAAGNVAGRRVAAGGNDRGGDASAMPPHLCRLFHMPLTSVAQFVGDAGGEAAAAAKSLQYGGSEGGDSGWEVLSVVLARAEMPAVGSSVPLLLPATIVQLEPQALGPATKGRGRGRGSGAQMPSCTPAPWPLPRPGDWIKLQDVQPRFVQGQLQFSMTHKSSLRVRHQHGRPAQGPTMRPLLPCGGPVDPGMWLARVCQPWHVLPLRTLRQVLMQQDTCDCAPARVVVRVMAVLNPQLPPLAGDTAPTSNMATCNTTTALSSELWRILRSAIMPASMLRTQQEVVGTSLDRSGHGLTYALALLVQDATASVRAVVLGGAANLFLWDVPPGYEHLADTEVTLQQPPQQQSQMDASSQLTAAGAFPNPRHVMTRSRSKVAAGAQAPAARPELQEARGQAATASAAQQQPSAVSEPHEQDRLVMVLRWLSEQRVPGGAWMEAVLRPIYRDRGNPWQSVVYSLEHTVLQVPHYLKPHSVPAGH